MSKRKSELFNILQILHLPNAIYILEIWVSFILLILINVIINPNLTFIKNFILYTILFQIAYFSVYIINDILDYQKDLKQKRQDKPLVTGKITLKQAKILLLIILGLVTLILIINKNLMGLILIFFIILYNIFYTKILKNNLITIIFGNGFTHFYRILLPLIYAFFYSNITNNKKLIIVVFMLLIYFWLTSSLFAFFKQALFKMNFKNKEQFKHARILLALLNLIILILGLYASFYLIKSEFIFGLFIILNTVNVVSIYVYKNKSELIKNMYLALSRNSK